MGYVSLPEGRIPFHFTPWFFPGKKKKRRIFQIGAWDRPMVDHVDLKTSEVDRLIRWNTMGSGWCSCWCFFWGGIGNGTMDYLVGFFSMNLWDCFFLEWLFGIGLFLFMFFFESRTPGGPAIHAEIHHFSLFCSTCQVHATYMLGTCKKHAQYSTCKVHARCMESNYMQITCKVSAKYMQNTEKLCNIHAT